MKKLFPLLLIPLLGLTACNSKGNKPSYDGSEQSGGSSQEVADWPTELKSLMISMYGEAIPYVALDSQTFRYEAYNYETELPENPDSLNIYDESEVDAFTGYAETLVSNGYVEDELVEALWEALGIEGYNSYYKSLEGFDLCVDFYHTDSFVDEETSEVVPAGNTMFVYTYASGDEGQEGTVSENENVYNEDKTDWSDELKGYMTRNVGEVLPFIKLDDEGSLFDVLSDGTVNVYDITENGPDLLTNAYPAILTAAGYELDFADFDSYGDMLYQYSKEVEEGFIIVQYQYYLIDGGTVNDIYFYLDDGSTPEGNYIDFSDESTYLADYDDDYGLIGVGNYLIEVEKGTSSTAVGNGQWPDQNGNFRFYTNQNITISWEGEAPSQIIFECSDNKYTLKSDSETKMTGATSVTNGDVTTLTVTGESVSFTISGQQFRVATIEFVE